MARAPTTKREPQQAPGNQGLTFGQATSPATGLDRAKDPNIGGGSAGSWPVLTSGLTFSELGSSGLRYFSGWPREEFLPALQGRQAAQKYREMMDNSPIIGALMLSITATMRRVEWRVVESEEGGDGAEGADFLDSCRDDMSHTWEDLMVENLSMLGYGFAPHEIVYKRRLGRDPGVGPDGLQLGRSKYDDGRVGWRRIPIRGQDTVLKWFFDPNGEIKGMTQQPWTGTIIDLPIEKMLLFRPSQHKNDPQGRSILRSAYVPYYFVKRMQEQESIMGERMGGIPVVRVPGTLIEQATAGQANAVAALAAYKKMATNVRIDEQMGMVLPSDMWPSASGSSAAPQYSFELVTPQGGRGLALNFNETIRRYNGDILTSVLADFIIMGHDARGAQNLGETKMDLFYQAIEGFLNSNAAIYNRHAIPRLWRLNGRDEDSAPTLEPDLAQRVDLDILSQFVLRLSQSGMPLFPNDELQTYLAEAAGLPDIVDPNAMLAAGLTDEQLARDEEMADASLDAAQNPAPVMSPLQKMIAASYARRFLRMNGATGVTKAAPRARRSGRLQRISRYARSA